MKNVIFLFLILIACHTEQAKVGKLQLKWIKEGISIPKSNKPLIVEIPTEEEIEEATNLYHLKIENFKKDFAKNKSDLGYNFYEIKRNDCNAKTTPSFKKVDQLKKYQPYQVKQINTTDSLYLDFTFISSCCQTFMGIANTKQDTLNLYYGNSKSEACLCFCEYTCRFALHKAKFKEKVKYFRFSNKLIPLRMN